MFIVETPSNPEHSFFIQEEEEGELRTTILFSAVGKMAIEETDDVFPQITCLLESDASTAPSGLKEYQTSRLSILSLGLDHLPYIQRLESMRESIDNAAATAQIDPYQWYERRKAAEVAQNIPITWITENGDASDRAILQGERIEISPMYWDSELHAIGKTPEGDLYPTIQDVDRVIGIDESPGVLEKYHIQEHEDGTHIVERLGIVMGREGENGTFQPLMTVLQHAPDTTEFVSSLSFYEMFTRDGDNIVSIARN